MGAAFVIEPFGEVDPSADDYWEAAVQYRSQTLQLDLNTDLGQINDVGVARANSLLSDIKVRDASAREAIDRDYAIPEGDARLFHAHHHECLREDAWLREIGEPKPSADDWQSFLKQCRLNRVGVYIEDADQFLVLDYTLGEGLTDYILSVSLDDSGIAKAVSMES